MKIERIKENEHLTLLLEGRLDSTSAPILENVLKQELDDVKTLVFDLGALEYLSSAGLRLLLAAQKRMNRQGSMAIKGISDAVMEVLEITGFIDILTIL